MKKALLAVGILSLLISCEGSRGPAGPQGLQGDQGEPGPGTRTVYISTNPIPTNATYAVSIPEIHLDDMPLVSVYVTPAGYSTWLELPIYVADDPYLGSWCFFEEAHVLFEGCQGLNYKIVIVE
jgi:hypothetical protein